MIGNSSKSQRELTRIFWRQQLLAHPVGRRWLEEQAADRKVKERDLGPHRFVPGFTNNEP